MHRRYDTTNIPIELLRTLVTISDLGTLTKAADALSLTQPAISAQIKRLQQIVGAEILQKWGGGVRLTEHGDMVVRHARRILAMNDQILLHLRSRTHARVVRIGISSIFAPSILPRIFKSLAEADVTASFQIECARSRKISHRMDNGYLDVGVIPLPDHPGVARMNWTERMVWICAPDFLLSPGKPLPLIGGPGTVSHQVAIETLERAGQSYTLAFVADDWRARFAALHSGLGYIAIPERAVEPGCKIAREHYLPPLPDLTTGIFVRDDIVEDYQAVVSALFDELNVGLPAPSKPSRPARANQRATTFS